MAKHLQRAIDGLMEHLISLSAKVEENVRLSIAAVEELDADLAGKVIVIDEEIDQEEIAIEEECLKIFALHQPVAIDLRYLVAVLKINNDLERIGDLALNIAEHGLHIIKAKGLLHKYNFHAISQKVLEMVNLSLDSLINLSAEMAKSVLERDDEVDNMNKQLCHQIQNKIKESPQETDNLIHYIHISRHLERIADHTTNIAEDIIYLTKGEIIRHGQGRID